MKYLEQVIKADHWATEREKATVMLFLFARFSRKPIVDIDTNIVPNVVMVQEQSSGQRENFQMPDVWTAPELLRNFASVAVTFKLYDDFPKHVSYSNNPPSKGSFICIDTVDPIYGHKHLLEGHIVEVDNTKGRQQLDDGITYVYVSGRCRNTNLHIRDLCVTYTPFTGEKVTTESDNQSKIVAMVSPFKIDWSKVNRPTDKLDIGTLVQCPFNREGTIIGKRYNQYEVKLQNHKTPLLFPTKFVKSLAEEKETEKF